MQNTERFNEEAKRGLERMKRGFFRSVRKGRVAVGGLADRTSICSAQSSSSQESSDSSNINFGGDSSGKLTPTKYICTQYPDLAEESELKAVNEEEWGAGLVLTWTSQTFVNGATYEGFMQNGLFSGLGLLLTPSFIYAGEWCDGIQQGLGVLINLLRRCNYEGVFVNGKANGHGREIVMDQDEKAFFYGQFVNGHFKPSHGHFLHHRQKANETAAEARMVASLAIGSLSETTRQRVKKAIEEKESAMRQVNAVAMASHDPPPVNPGPVSSLMQLLT